MIVCVCMTVYTCAHKYVYAFGDHTHLVVEEIERDKGAIRAAVDILTEAPNLQNTHCILERI